RIRAWRLRRSPEQQRSRSPGAAHTTRTRRPRRRARRRRSRHRSAYASAIFPPSRSTEFLQQLGQLLDDFFGFLTPLGGCAVELAHLAVHHALGDGHIPFLVKGVQHRIERAGAHSETEHAHLLDDLDAIDLALRSPPQGVELDETPLKLAVDHYRLSISTFDIRVRRDPSRVEARTCVSRKREAVTPPGGARRRAGRNASRLGGTASACRARCPTWQPRSPRP